MNYCTNCGQPLPENAKACPNCGTFVEGAAPETPVQSVPDPAPQPFSAPPQSNYASAQPYHAEGQTGANAQQPYDVYAQPQQAPGRGMGIASLILGIAGIVLFCLPCFGLPCSIVGLILGCMSNAKAKQAGMKNGVALGGIITSSIGLAINLIILVLAIIGIAVAGPDILNSINY